MRENVNKNLDPRIKTIFGCAIDYSSWYDESEEEQCLDSIAKRFSIDIKVVKKIRAWWFEEVNQLLKDLEEAIVQFSKKEGQTQDEIETLEAQFESDVFCADLIVFIVKPPSDDDVQFAEQIQVNDVDPDDLAPLFAKFLKSTIPMEITVKFFNTPQGEEMLSLV
jgi:hypothetical protein